MTMEGEVIDQPFAIVFISINKASDKYPLQDA